MSIQFEDSKVPLIISSQQPVSRERSQSFIKCPMPVDISDQQADELFKAFKERVQAAQYPGKRGVFEEQGVSATDRANGLFRRFVNSKEKSPIQEVHSILFKKGGCGSKTEMHLKIVFEPENSEFYEYLVSRGFPVDIANYYQGTYYESHPENIKTLLEKITKHNDFPDSLNQLSWQVKKADLILGKPRGCTIL